jgi:hypothetical protein
VTTVEASPQIVEAHCLAVAGSFTIPAGPPVDDAAEKRAQGWQTRAWDVWHRLGEIRFPTSFLARQTTRIEWRVKPSGAEEPLDDVESRKLIDEVTKGIGQDEAARLICLNLQVAGEGYYVEDGEGDFHVYSVVEKGLDKKLKKARDAKLAALRFYYPDPTDTDAAESSIRTALDPAEELIALTDLSRAQSRSRLSQAGLLLYPAGQSWASENPFEAGLQEAMMAPIKDVQHPAAMVPITIAMDGELIEKVKHITFDRSYDEKVPQKIETATRRIALAVDTDPELILGMADANHWTAWNVTEERYNAYMGPLAARTAEVFAAVIELKHADMAGVEVIPDPSAILARKSTIRDALDAYTAPRPAVSAAYVRETMGATDDDAPTEEELAALEPATVEERAPLVEENPGPPIAASMTSDRYVEGQIEGAVAMAIDQARAKVGAKLRTKMRGNPDEERLAAVPNSQCAATCQDHLGEIDVDGTILDALAPLMSWWEGRGMSLSSRQARLIVATYVSETIRSMKAEPTPELMRSLGA